MPNTFRLSLFNWATVPDDSGNVWWIRLDSASTNLVWKHGIWRFKDTSTRIGLYGSVDIPPNYNPAGTTSLIVVPTSIATLGAMVWDLDYRAVGGHDTESLDQSGNQESVSVTVAAPGGPWRRLEGSVALTAANIAPNDTLEFGLFRDGSDATDNLPGDVFLSRAFLQYTD